METKLQLGSRTKSNKLAIPRQLPNGIANFLSEKIRSGTFKTGDRLPSERQLSEQFGVSRPVVREALSQLRSDGLIAAQQGRGSFVAEGHQRQSFKLQDTAPTEKLAQSHVLELLVAIEVAATRLAASRRTPEDLRSIRRALVGMEYAIVNDRLGDEEDFAFHQAIVAATHNPFFRELSEHLENGVRRLIRRARSHTQDLSGQIVKVVQREHQAIFDAIEVGDAIAAALAAETHLTNAAKRLDVATDIKRKS